MICVAVELLLRASVMVQVGVMITLHGSLAFVASLGTPVMIAPQLDRKGVVWGKSADLGGRRTIKTKLAGGVGAVSSLTVMICVAVELLLHASVNVQVRVRVRS